MTKHKGNRHMATPDKGHTAKILSAVTMLSASLGMSPAMASEGPASPTAQDSRQIKWHESNQHKVESSQIKLDSNQHKLESNQLKLDSNQHKLESNQLKLDSNQHKLESNQLKLDSNQHKLESNQQKLDSHQIKFRGTGQGQ